MFETGQTFQQFLDDYYEVGLKGYLQFMGDRYNKGQSLQRDELKKILTATEANWYEASYSKGVQVMAPFNTELYKLLDKRPITTVGDSFKYTKAHGLTTTAIGPLGATAMFGSPTEPTVAPITNITSGVENVILSRDLHSMVKERAPGADVGADWNWLVNELAPTALYDKIDTWLGGYETAAGVHGLDTPALKNIECIDRMASTKAETLAGTYVSAITDGDIVWDGIGTGTPKFDRDSITDADATIKLNSVAATNEAYEIIIELEKLMKTSKRYSKNKRYIGVTTGATMNKIQWEVGGAARYEMDGAVDVAINVNGVETRPGVQGGFSVGSLILAGVKVPMFVSEALPTTNSVFTAGSGHCYLIDLDAMYIRTDIPMTYIESGFGPEMLSVNLLASRGFLFTLSQLVCTGFPQQAALKYIAA